MKIVNENNTYKFEGYINNIKGYWVVEELNIKYDDFLNICKQYGAKGDGWLYFEREDDILRCQEYLEGLKVLNKIVGE